MKSYFQTDSWGEFKSGAGWSFGRVGDEALRLSRELPFKRTMYYYPELAFDVALIQRIRTAPVGPSAIFSRFEFLDEYSEEKAAELKELDLIKSFEEVQPEFRQWVDINKPEHEILAGMKPKGRYNIGVAQRSGLAVVRGGAELVSDFFKLYTITSKRTKFSGRAEGYFAKLMDVLVKDKVGEIIIVKKGDVPLAGGVFLYYEEMASYLYGGSSNEERQLMAPYLMHWTAIAEAKKRDCRIYDLLAVSPLDDNGEPVENHAYAGITRFKTQFGGKTVRLLGSWDLVHNPFWYKLYKLAEQRRRPKNTT